MMVLNILVIGLIICMKEKENMNGMIKEFMKVISMKIISLIIKLSPLHCTMFMVI